MSIKFGLTFSFHTFTVIKTNLHSKLVNMSKSSNSTMNTAVFINIKSIQNYVFNTNKLKHVVGASHIVKHAFDFFNPSVEENINSEEDIEVGYIGGGNALLFFKDKSKAEEIIMKFTKKALIHYPGLVFGIGMQNTINNSMLKGDDYKKLMKELVKNVGVNLNNHYPITNILKHGITADCPYSGLSAEFYYDLKQQYISRSVKPKVDVTILQKVFDADKLLLKEAEFDDTFVFASEFEDMGQVKGVDSHIAIVHIDGNGIGKKFQDSKSLEESKKLSTATKEIIVNSFIEVLKEIRQLVTEEIIDIQGIEEKVLPLRPIILSGDEITFVCNSKLGIWIAQRFMKHFSSSKNGEKSVNFTACAGVCITKTKYPFYRGYQLAVELCEHAKEAFSKNGKQGNWLDFHLAQTDISDELSQIRQKQYTDANGNSLLKRPYNTYDLDKAIKKTIKLSDKLPEGWTKELRDVLYEGENAWQLWMKKADWRKKDYKFTDDGKTVSKDQYYDLIELHEIIDNKLFTNCQFDNNERI